VKGEVSEIGTNQQETLGTTCECKTEANGETRIGVLKRLQRMRSWKRKGNKEGFHPDVERAASNILYCSYWFNSYTNYQKKRSWL